MKVLVIHGNKFFFKSGYVPFYLWLGEQRGKGQEAEKISDEYYQKYKAGPLLLPENYKVTVGGLSQAELQVYISEYNTEFFDENMYERLALLQKEYDFIILLTSYPKELYQHMVEKDFLSMIFGADSIYVDNKIDSLADVTLQHHEKVQQIFSDLGLEDSFDLIPHRYGLLAKLIDFKLEKGIKDEEVLVVGDDVKARPLHYVSTGHVKDFDELK